MRRSERSRLDPDIGVLTSRTTSTLQRVLQKAGAVPIGPRHRAVLAYLDTDGSRAVDLARQSGQHKQVVGTLVDELEQLGYVRREPDPSDRRAKLIVPTEAGLRLMSTIDAALAEVERELADTLGAREYEVFKRSFQRVADVLSERAGRD